MILLVLCLLDVEQANVGIFPPYKPRKIRTTMMRNFGRFEPSLEENKEENKDGRFKKSLMQKYIWSQIVHRMN